MYTYLICIIFAILAMLCNTQRIASHTTTSNTDQDALLQRSVDRQVLAEVKEERLLQLRKNVPLRRKRTQDLAAAWRSVPQPAAQVAAQPAAQAELLLDTALPLAVPYIRHK